MQIFRKLNGKPFLSRIDRFLFLAVFILLVVFFAVNMSPGVPAGNTVELHLSSSYKELIGKEMAVMLAYEFMEQNPGLQIRFVDEEADILFFTGCDLAEIFYSNALGAEPVIIPLVSYMDMLFYNIELLKAAGFDRPPQTGAEFTAWGRAAGNTGNGVIGFAMGLNPNDRRSLSRDIYSWIWAAGGDFWPFSETFSGRTDRPVFNSPITISTLFFLRELYRAEILAAGIFDKTGGELLEKFAEGKIAMLIASTREIPLLRKRMGNGAFGVTAIPSVAAPGAGSLTRKSIALSHIYAGINPYCAHIDIAKNFLAFLAERNNLISASLEAVPGVIPDSSAGFSFGQHIANDPHHLRAWDIFESSSVVQGFSGRALAQEFEDIVREELQAFFGERQTATVTANMIQNRWDALYSRQ